MTNYTRQYPLSITQLYPVGDSIEQGFDKVDDEFTALITHINDLEEAPKFFEEQTSWPDTSTFSALFLKDDELYYQPQGGTSADAWAITKSSGTSLRVDDQTSRPKFEFASTTAIRVNTGRVYFQGTNYDGNVEITSAFTKQIGAVTSAEPFYMCLDDDVVSGVSYEATSAAIVFSTTDPDYSHTKKGWYIGNDKVIFANIGASPTTQREFYHDGGSLVRLAEAMATNIAATDVDLTFLDCNTKAPDFGDNAMIEVTGFVTAGGGTPTKIFWRKNGATTSNGIALSNGSATTDGIQPTQVFVDASQIFEVKLNSSDASTVTLYLSGFYLPENL